MNTLSRALGLAVVAAVVATSSGCSIIDRLFLLNTDGPHGHHAAHAGGGACQDGMCQEGVCGPEGCPPGGGCQQGCQQEGCQDCAGGVCHPRHVGRYGGLAKHHLTPEEKAALAGSDYGATQPAGPPTGAVAYPYYTTRGPRDFLAKCPPSIGPQ
ncbi:MAG: hypothetical protein ACKO4Z_06915 [Planctomycetota bacterium]